MKLKHNNKIKKSQIKNRNICDFLVQTTNNVMKNVMVWTVMVWTDVYITWKI